MNAFVVTTCFKSLLGALLLVTLVACGSSDASSPPEGIATAGAGSADRPTSNMGESICRKIDKLLRDNCDADSFFNHLADDNYQCKSAKDLCRAQCVDKNAKTCEE